MIIEKNKKIINFEDIILQKQYSIINSRSEVDTSTNFLDHKITIPIISSPMSSITEAFMINALTARGTTGILHRYNTIQFQEKLISFINPSAIKIVALGINDYFIDRLDMLLKNNIKIICLESSHVFSKKYEDAIDYIKKSDSNIKIITGPIQNINEFNFLLNKNVDAIRVGYGSGACSNTYENIAITSSTPQLLIEIEDLNLKTRPMIIADGGHKNYGDIIKSIALGADIVMLGFLLAGTKETPGKFLIEDEENYTKKIIGNGSKTNQQIYRDKYNTIEGKDIEVKLDGTINKIIGDISMSLKSAMSYSDSINLKEFKQKNLLVLKG